MLPRWLVLLLLAAACLVLAVWLPLSALTDLVVTALATFAALVCSILAALHLRRGDTD